MKFNKGARFTIKINKRLTISKQQEKGIKVTDLWTISASCGKRISSIRATKNNRISYFNPIIVNSESIIPNSTK